MDAIQALKDWTTKHFSDVDVEWTFAQTTATDQSNTARFEGDHAPTLHQSFAVNWYIGEFCGRVTNDDDMRCSEAAKTIMEEMLLCGEILMPDDSPMFIKKVRVEQGQIHLIGQYGVLVQSRRYDTPDKLERVGVRVYSCEERNNAPLKNLNIHGGMHGKKG